MTDKLRIPVIVMISMASGYIGGQMNKPAEAVGKPAAVVSEVRAKSFVLVDDTGTRRGLFTMAKYGPALHLFNASSQQRAEFALTKDGSILALKDEYGKTGSILGVYKEGPTLNMYDLWDAGSTRRQMLTVTKAGPIFIVR